MPSHDDPATGGVLDDSGHENAPLTLAPPIHATSVSSFTMFSKLPKEIRLMIWEAAMPGPRIVPIMQRELNKTIGQ